MIKAWWYKHPIDWRWKYFYKSFWWCESRAIKFYTIVSLVISYPCQWNAQGEEKKSVKHVYCSAIFLTFLIEV